MSVAAYGFIVRTAVLRSWLSGCQAIHISDLYGRDLTLCRRFSGTGHSALVAALTSAKRPPHSEACDNVLTLLMFIDRRFILTSAAAIVSTPQGLFAASPLRFGLTPVFRQDDLTLLDSIRSYLETACGRPVELVSRRTYREITAELLSGRLDAAWICGYPYVANRDRLEALATPVWRGAPLYRSYLIAAKDRDASDIDDLRQDVHAFSDPESNSGYLVTQALLASRGTIAERYFERSFFTYGHRNVVRAVAAGLAQSGSVDGYVVEALRRAEPTLVAGIKVVWRSAEMGFPPVACLRDMQASPGVQSIRAALLSMAEHPDGRTALSLMELDGFTVVPTGHYSSIEADMRRVERTP